MVWHKANRLQQYTKTLKEATMEAIRLRTLRAKEPTVKEVKAKLKISAEKDI